MELVHDSAQYSTHCFKGQVKSFLKNHSYLLGSLFVIMLRPKGSSNRDPTTGLRDL